MLRSFASNSNSNKVIILYNNWKKDLHNTEQKVFIMAKNLLIATHNKNKIREFYEIIKNTGEMPFLIELMDLETLNITEDADEPFDTFLENAKHKAKFYYDITCVPCIAEDAGLKVDLLDGRPGVLSARWTGVHADDKTNNKKLVEELNRKAIAESPASYISTLAIYNGNKYYVATGDLKGFVRVAPHGSFGFSYDPYFYLPDGRSLGDLTDEQKNAISHRRKALEAIKQIIIQNEQNIW